MIYASYRKLSKELKNNIKQKGVDNFEIEHKTC